MANNPKVLGKVIYNVMPQNMNDGFTDYRKSGRILQHSSNITFAEVDKPPASGGGLALPTGATALWRHQDSAYTYYKWGPEPKDWTLLWKTSGDGIEWGDGIGGGGPGGGTAGRLRDYQFNIKATVPNSGLRFFSYGEVATSAAPLIINVDSILIGASISVDKIDASRDYQMVILINGVIEETLALLSGDVSNYSTSFTATIVPGDEISLYLERVTGSGKSTFSKVSAAIEIEEVEVP